MVESLRIAIELVITRQEQAGGFMAATHGRLTGKPASASRRSGPRADPTTAAAYAHVGAMPMVMITGQKGILTSRQARFQSVDIVAAMKPLTKLAHRIVATGTIPTLVREAFRVAEEERPGPVLLELPEDIAAEKCDRVRMVPPHPLELPIASPAMLDRAAGMIIAAKRPLLMLGAAASRPRSSAELAQFVLRTRIPYFTTQMGKGVVPGGTELYMGTAALSERDYVHDAIEQADLIVTIGHDTSEKPPFMMHDDRPVVIHVAYQSATVEQVYFPQAEVVGDMGRSLGLLADRLDGKLPHAGALLPLREGILNHLAERATEDRWTPQRIVHDVRQVMPADGIVASTTVCTRSGSLATTGPGGQHAAARQRAGHDGSWPAVGHDGRDAHPGRRVLAVCGDGGFMMNSQEIETAVRRRLDLVVLVLVDGAFGMIRWKQAVDGFADSGMTFGNPDFAMYARAYGAHGHNVREVGELVPTLEAAFRAGGVHLIAVPIDYSENKRVLVDELRDRTPAGQNLVHPRDA